MTSRVREVIGMWRKSIVHHVYYVAATARTEEDLVEAMWVSIANRMIDVHEHDNELYPMCDHPHLIGVDRQKERLQPGL